jgi:hypothetical protein
VFEHRRDSLLPRPLFFWRVCKYGLVSFGLAAASLLLGILGYRQLEGMSWLDAFVNAAMILGGMGPVTELHTRAGKFFNRLLGPLLRTDRGDFHGYSHCPDFPPLSAPLPFGGIGGRRSRQS